MNTVIERMNVLSPAQGKVPRNRLPQLHVLHDSVRDLETDPMRAVRLLNSVPPLLAVRVDPAPVGVGRPAEGDIGTGDFEPVAGEGLDEIKMLGLLESVQRGLGRTVLATSAWTVAMSVG